MTWRASVRWVGGCGGAGPLSRPGHSLAEVLTALWARTWKSARSANDVLRMLGEPEGPPAALVAPHPALLAWSSAAWADGLLAQGHVWEVVRGADEADLDRWALGAVAGRLLVTREIRTAGWRSAPFAGCSPTPARRERDAFRAQALEANARAKAPWHTASRALTDLIGAGESVGALCETAQYARATRRAQKEGGGGALALVGFCADDPALVEDALLDAAPDDVYAVRVAASQLLSRRFGKPPSRPPGWRSPARGWTWCDACA